MGFSNVSSCYLLEIDLYSKVVALQSALGNFKIAYYLLHLEFTE